MKKKWFEVIIKLLGYSGAVLMTIAIAKFDWILGSVAITMLVATVIVIIVAVKKSR